MSGYMYASIIQILKEFRQELRSSAISYYLRCTRCKKSCLIIVKLRSKATNKRVLKLSLKVRNMMELNDLENMLSSCMDFVCHRPTIESGSPEY